MKESKSGKFIGIILISTIIIACVVVLIISMKGETKTSGQNPTSVASESLVCESTEINYPIASYDNSISKKLKIITNFYDGKANAISLAYELFYNNTQQVTASEAHNHAAMNISFGKDGLNADAFNANYSKMENSMKMSLYTNTDNIKPISAKYFMLSVNNTDSLPSTIQEYQTNYEKQSFICNLNN